MTFELVEQEKNKKTLDWEEWVFKALDSIDISEEDLNFIGTVSEIIKKYGEKVEFQCWAAVPENYDGMDWFGGTYENCIRELENSGYNKGEICLLTCDINGCWLTCDDSIEWSRD